MTTAVRQAWQSISDAPATPPRPSRCGPTVRSSPAGSSSDSRRPARSTRPYRSCSCARFPRGPLGPSEVHCRRAGPERPGLRCFSGPVEGSGRGWSTRWHPYSGSGLGTGPTKRVDTTRDNPLSPTIDSSDRPRSRLMEAGARDHDRIRVRAALFF